ncbi:MAG: polysaccharide pyruvyl transferase family protein [Rhodoglobus sp.]
MKLSSIGRRAKKTIQEAVVSLGLSSARDRRVFRLAATAQEGPRTKHLLLAAPGGGNIGDQAMLEAFLEGVEGEVVVIVRDAWAVTIPTAHAERAELLVMPHLLYSDGRPHYEAVAEFRRLLGQALSFSVTGADIMDGKYSLRASVRRSNLAEYAATAGVHSRILGFSWNAAPRQAALTALRRASQRGVVPLLRDPVSVARARAQGVQQVQEVADIVFSATSVDNSIVDRLGLDLSDERPLVVVNVSGLIGRTMNQLGEYQVIVDQLRALGRRVLIVPHVRSQLADDLVACTAVADHVGRDGVTLVERMLSPAEIRGLTAAAEFVITGRMHLAIMALWNGVPAITLATQGKVEGLMALFDSQELCVEPSAGFGFRVVDTINGLVDGSSATRERIRELLPAVTALSRGNVEGIKE